MQKLKGMALGLVGAAALSLPTLGMAQGRMDSMRSAMTGPESHWYVGGSIGQSKFKVDCSGASCDDTDTAFRVFGGYMFNKNFAIEGFYAEGFDKTENGFTAKLDGVGVGVVGKKNFGANDTGFFVDGRVGAVRNNLKLAISGVGEATDSSVKPYVGVGVGYDFSPQWGLSLNYDWNKVDAFDFDGSVKTLTAGVEYRF